jgi:hypothetical protein
MQRVKFLGSVKFRQAVEKLAACFDGLSMNGYLLMISRPIPFALRVLEA